MRELPDNNFDEARRWMASVEGDLRAMRALQRDSLSPGRIVCFLAHLAVEKALKAVLIDTGIPFQKTHNLVHLHEMCVGAGRLTGLDVQPLGALNPWGIDGRYAEDDPRDADRSFAQRMTHAAENVVAMVRAELEEGGRRPGRDG
ncbi:MAG: HEPN domain-containing protein [Acidimicrobiales bacterium]